MVHSCAADEEQPSIPDKPDERGDAVVVPRGRSSTTVVVIAAPMLLGFFVAITSCGSGFIDALSNGRRDGDGGAGLEGGGGTDAEPSICGDNKRGINEPCEGADLNQASCATAVARGWIGDLSCTSKCTFETKSCVTPPTTYNAMDVNVGVAWSTFDLANFSADAKGYRGAAFDGRYVYFVPYDNNVAHGIVARYDTQGGFKTVGASSSWKKFDISNAKAGAKGFQTAAFDGQYVYFVPANEAGIGNGIVARYDTKKDFGDLDAWKAFDVAASLNEGAKGYTGAVFADHYVYLIPDTNGTTQHGIVVRCDTQKDFSVKDAWSVFDVADVDSVTPSRAKGFAGGAFDGRYIYLAPSDNGVPDGLVARYDTSADFRARASWELFELTANVDPRAKGFHGAVFADHFIYFVPSSGGVVTRFDKDAASFTTSAGWKIFDVSKYDARASGFRGAVFDGQNIYFVPYNNGGYHGFITRYDTKTAFDDADTSGWSVFDTVTLDPNAKGFVGGAFDGRYLYLVPAINTVTVRFDAKSPSWLPLRWNASFF